MKYLKRVELLAIAIAIGTVALGMVSSHAQDSARTTVKVLRLDGPELSGGLVNASQEGIELTVDGEKQLLAGNALSRVVFENRVGSGGVQPLLLGLVDGSRLVGAKISGKEQGWQVADSAGGVLGVGPGSVRYLQVRPLAGELRKSFDAAILEPATSDSLLVVRPGDTLDRVNGLIKEIKESKVLFDLDGDVVEVSFEKLAGMVWFRKASERVKPKVAVNTTDGGTVYPDTFRLVGDRFELQGSAGDLSIPINRIASLDYGSANLRWLSEIELLDSKAEKRMDWKFESKTLGKALAPHFEAKDADTATGLGVDLLFPMPGSYTFRVPEGFTRLQTRMVRGDRGEQRSELTIEVWQDDVKVLDKRLATSEEALELDVPLTAGKKVRLSVRSKSRLMVGTEVRCQQPRLTR
jgi:hypothetical protein